MKPTQAIKPSAIALATLLAMTSLLAHAQSAGRQNQANNSKTCAAATNAAGTSNASDADMNATYSSCRLDDGYIGIGAFTNDGSSDADEFNKKNDATPQLKKPDFNDATHNLSMFDGNGGSGANGSGKHLRASGHAATGGDRYAALSQQASLPGWDAYRAPGLLQRGAPEDMPSFLGSAQSVASAVPASGGVGGGGPGGGLESRSPSGFINDVPVIPAVPEPESYWMLLAGLGVLAALGRKKIKRK